MENTIVSEVFAFHTEEDELSSMMPDVAFDLGEEYAVGAEQIYRPTKQRCLCSGIVPDSKKHDSVRCAWYIAMSEVSKLTGIPPPWEEDSILVSNKKGDAHDATMAELVSFFMEEPQAFDNPFVSGSPFVPSPSVQATTDQQPELLIHTDPEKVFEARKTSKQRTHLERRRDAHHERINRLKTNRAQLWQSVEGVHASQNRFNDPQTLPAIDDYVPADSSSLAPMQDCWSIGEKVKGAASNTLEPLACTTLEAARVNMHGMHGK